MVSPSFLPAAPAPSQSYPRRGSCGVAAPPVISKHVSLCFVMARPRREPCRWPPSQNWNKLGMFSASLQPPLGNKNPGRKCRVQFALSHPISRPTASKIGHLRSQFGGGKPVKPTASTGFMERAMGIEPTSDAWDVRPHGSSILLSRLNRFAGRMPHE
jgi:hypothetical protein